MSQVAFATQSYREPAPEPEDDAVAAEKPKKRTKKQSFESEDYVVLLGPPALLDQVNSISTILPTNIWISVQTKDQFIQQASKMVQKQV